MFVGKSATISLLISNLLEIKRKNVGILRGAAYTRAHTRARFVPKGLIFRDNDAQSYHCFPVISLARFKVTRRRLYSSRVPRYVHRLCRIYALMCVDACVCGTLPRKRRVFERAGTMPWERFETRVLSIQRERRMKNLRATHLETLLDKM